MKYISALILSLFFTSTVVLKVGAQSVETIWIQSNSTAFKTGESIVVTVNANSTTPIQGFTAQIRYDPSCLQPINATSSISGMNGLVLPQTPGLVDASFASSTPQIINGVLAEIHFTALKGCQTILSLETAALAVRNETGFAVPLAGVSIGNKAIILNIDSAVGIPEATQPVALDGSVLPLVPAIVPEKAPINWWAIALLVVLVGLAIATVVIIYKLSQN